MVFVKFNHDVIERLSSGGSLLATLEAMPTSRFITGSNFGGQDQPNP